jgi:hypothetical protein
MKSSCYFFNHSVIVCPNLHSQFTNCSDPHCTSSNSLFNCTQTPLKVFKSHAKSSQADFFFNCELPAAVSYRQLLLLPSLYYELIPATGCRDIDSSRTQQKTQPVLFKKLLYRSVVAIEVYCCGADHLENTSTVLLTAYVCCTVYRAVAWQRFDEIRHNTFSKILPPTSMHFATRVRTWRVAHLSAS